MDAWVARHAERIEGHARDHLAALVGVSSPSGDAAAAEEAVAVARLMLPEAARVERVPCSSPEHAPDLVARITGGGTRRLLLVGHLDTVVPHADHRPLRIEGDRLVGSGSVDMKGGDVLALGVLRALAAGDGGPDFAEVALLLVNDEEWRVVPFAHAERFAGFDACLCFEAGQRGPDGEEGVVVQRKGAGTIRVTATGREAHSGSAPEKGANALLALAEAARVIAAQSDPAGADRLTAVPTIIRSGDAFNVVPAAGELLADLRASNADAFDAVIAAVPGEHGGATLDTRLLRHWPGMDAREATRPLIERAADLLGVPLHAGARGGASDASHLAQVIPVTVDGLGPRGGGAHAPHEYVSAASVRPRAAVALAMATAAAST